MRSGAAGRPVGFYLLYLSSAAAITLLPDHGGTVFASWSEITLGGYLRLGAGILMLGLLPGLILVRVFLGRSAVHLSPLERIPPAFVFSLFIALLAEWVLLRLEVPLGAQRPALVLFWLGLLLLPLALRPPRPPANPPGRGVAGRIHDGPLLGLIILSAVAAAVALNFLDRVLFFDAPLHISGALSILRAGRPLEEDHFLQRITGAGLWYPSWFRILLAALFQVSGAPPLNAAHAFDLLLFRVVPVLAFYQMVRGFESQPHRAVTRWATVVFFTFSGFFWLAAAKSGPAQLLDLVHAVARWQPERLFDILDLVSGQNAFVGRYPIYTQLIHAVVPQPIGLTALFLLLSLLARNDLPDVWRATVIFSATAVGFLVHEVEIVLLVLVYYPLATVLLRGAFHPRLFYSATFGAFILIVLLDLLGPARFFVGRGEFWIALVATLSLPLWSAVARVNWRSIRQRLVPLFPHLSGAATLLIAGGYSYLVLRWLGEGGRVQSWLSVPLSYFPVTYGIAGFLTVVEVLYLLRRPDRLDPAAGFLLAALGAAIATAKVATRFSSQVHEYRFLLYAFIPGSILAGRALARLSGAAARQPTHRLRRIALSLVGALTVVSGVSGTAFALAYWRLSPAHLSYQTLHGERGAIDFLRRHRPLHTDVATTNWLSRVAVIYSSAEHNWVTDLEPLFGETDPLAAMNFLRQRDISYVYVTPRDLSDLAARGFDKGFLSSHLAPYLPLAYADANVSLYRIPPLAPPVTTAATGLIVPSTVFLVDAIALAGIAYASFLGLDGRQYESSTLVLDDISRTDLPVDELAPWERKWGAGVKVSASGTALAFATRSDQQTQLWASYRVPEEVAGRRTHLCLTYRARSLPRSAYYYFELQDVRLRRTFSSALPAQEGERSECHLLPAGLRPSWLTFAIDTGAAGMVDAVLEIKRIRFLSAAGALWRPELVEPNPDRYLSWVKAGGHLVVVGDAQGELASALALKVAVERDADGVQMGATEARIPPVRIRQVAASDARVVATAHYRWKGKPIGPYAFTRRLGRGRITYVYLGPVFQALDESAGTPRGRALFLALGELLRGLPVGWAVGGPDAERVYGFGKDIGLTGGVRIESAVPPIFPPGAVRVQTLTLAPRGGAKASPQGAPRRLTDLILESVESRGTSTSLLRMNRVGVTPRGVGPYVSLDAPGSFDWILTSAQEITMVVRSRWRRMPLRLNGGVVSFRGVTTAGDGLLLFRPRFAVRGRATFGYATLWHDQPHGGISWRSWMTVDGRAEFATDYGGTYLHMFDISLDGQVQVDRTNEWWDLPDSTRTIHFPPGAAWHGLSFSGWGRRFRHW